jgi:hypothetical protein
MAKPETQASITSTTIAKLSNNIYTNKCITAVIKDTHLEAAADSKTVKMCER